MSAVDPHTGRRFIMGNDHRLQVMLQREKDLFYMTEGIKTEDVGKWIRANPDKMGLIDAQKMEELKK